MADGDDVADVGRFIPALLEYRVRQLEINQEKMLKRMDGLATSEQMDDLKATVEQRAQRGFTFWVMIVGGPSLAGIIVALATFAIANAMGLHR